MTLPELGESVTEGTVTRWLKAVGDDVAVDEPLLEISTDKVDTEIPSPVAGTLLEIKVDEDETVEVGAELAIIGDADGSSSDEKEPEPEKEEAKSEPEPEPEPEPEEEEAKAEPEPEKEAEPEKESEPEPEPASSSSEPPEPEEAPTPPPAPSSGTSDSGASGAGTQGGGDTYVTPIVRKLAKQHGVDLAAITGTGVGGRIRKQDVLDAAEKTPAAAASSSVGSRGDGAVSAARQDREAEPAAQDHRHPHGRVAAGLGPAHPGPRGRRHRDRPPARAAEGRLPRARGRQAHLPAVLRQGRDRGAQGAPEGQRATRRRGGHGHLPRR